jgi:hypothetical protein
MVIWNSAFRAATFVLAVDQILVNPGTANHF